MINIEGDAINRDNVKKRLRKSKPKLFFFNGHGSQSSLFDNNEVEFFTLDDAGALQDTVAFARACDCLSKLGEQAVREGCKAFVGYKRKFWLARDHSMTSRPLKDRVAKPILECSDAVVYELIKGKSVHDAVEKSHKLAAAHIVNLMYSNDPFMSATLSALINNDTALGYHGDPHAKV
jgi:hypothetical protein